jgi:hypothetical protein
VHEEWFGGLTMVQLTLNHIDASLDRTSETHATHAQSNASTVPRKFAGKVIECHERRNRGG